MRSARYPLTVFQLILMVFVGTWAAAQQTHEYLSPYYPRVSASSDGGYVITQTSTSGLEFHKYDSNSVFQTGRRVPILSAKGGEHRMGKVFAVLGTNNYYIDVAKVDVSTGNMQAYKRIQGPTGGQTYFTAGPAQILPTADSGVVLVLMPNQCYEIAGCQSCMLKLDKNLNHQFFAGTIFNGGSGSVPNPAVATENPDGSIVMAQNVFNSPGFPLVMVRYNGTTGAVLNSRTMSNANFIMPAMGISANPGRILLGTGAGSDAALVSLSNDLTILHWSNLYSGFTSSNSGQWRFSQGSGGNYYGSLGGKFVSITPTGALRWCKSVGSPSTVSQWMYPRQNRMVQVFNPSTYVGRVAVIDSLGNGLCSAVDLTPSVTSLTLTQPVVSVANSVFNPLSNTALPPVPSNSYTPTMTLVCTAICTFTASFNSTNNQLAYQFSAAPSGLSAYQWNFGDGGTGTGMNPSHTYSAPGTYTVCLIGTSGCMSDTVCQQVTVTCTATNASFTATTNQLVAAFTNSSTGTGPLAYSWDFGDGGSSTQASPSHTYASPGNYNVCLITTGPCGTDTTCSLVNAGCVSTVAGFSSTTNQLVANFTNSSTGAGVLTYSWDFGDGGTSTSSNPSHTYAAGGTYTVCLVVGSPCGADTSCQQLTITCPLPMAAFSDSSYLLTATFTNSSAGAITYAWDFGDGNTSTLASPGHTYAASGTYTVCLIASSPCGADTTCQQVTITCPMPVPAFSASVNQFTATFTNLSSMPPGSAYFWDFGDGSTDLQLNTVHTYAQPGDYLVCFFISSPCGTTYICDTITVACPPLVAAMGNSGSFPTIQFLDMTIGAPNSWRWTFGDGGISNSQHPSHAYASAGTYTVCLVASDGCSSDTTCQAVDVLVGLNAPTASRIELYPVPAADHAWVSWQMPGLPTTVRVATLDGRVMFEAEKCEAGLSLDVRDWPQGVYAVEVRADGWQATRKLVVLH